MLKALAGVLLAAGAAPVWAASPTDFGVRAVSGEAALTTERAVSAASTAITGSRINLSAAASLGSRWGRVTSTWRSRERNRRVGGVANSFHLSGRAIDIARRPGVTHSQIAAAFRNAGYRLIESLDEGDHSHFAFGTGAVPIYRSLKPQQAPQQQRSASTQWRVVTVASAILK